MKKVLIVTNNLSGGGEEKVLITLLNHIDYSKFEIDLVLIKNIGVYLNDIPKQVKMSWVLDCSKENKIFPKDIQLIKKLYNEKIKKTYDIEIAFLEGPPTLFISCSNNPKSLKYAWVHVDINAFHWTEKYYENLESERNTYLKMDKIIFVSKSNLEMFKQKFNIYENLFVYYNPIDENDIIKKSNLFLVEKEKFRFCYVASISYRKGQDKLIYAMQRLINEGYNCELYLIGCGDKMDDFIDLAKKYKIENDIKFIGFNKNPYPYIKSSDVFVHASDSEGYPTVLCESLILHKPIVATNCNGNIDVLENGKYGLLVSISADGLYSGMKQMMESSKLREKFINNSSLWTKNYTLKNNIRKIEELLEGTNEI